MQTFDDHLPTGTCKKQLMIEQPREREQVLARGANMCWKKTLGVGMQTAVETVKKEVKDSIEMMMEGEKKHVPLSR